MKFFMGCQMTFGEKMRFHIKWNLYCQTKVKKLKSGNYNVTITQQNATKYANEIIL